VHDTDKHTVPGSSDHTVLRQQRRNAVRQLKSDGTEHRVSERPESRLRRGSVRAETKRHPNLVDERVLLCGNHNVDHDVQHYRAMETGGDCGHSVSNFDRYRVIDGNRVPTNTIDILLPQRDNINEKP